jgi:hypothetical protein
MIVCSLHSVKSFIEDKFVAKISLLQGTLCSRVLLNVSNELYWCLIKSMSLSGNYVV